MININNLNSFIFILLIWWKAPAKSLKEFRPTTRWLHKDRVGGASTSFNYEEYNVPCPSY